MAEQPVFYSEWYANNRERLLPIRRAYNKGYSKRKEVIEKAKLKNARPEQVENRKRYKKSVQGKLAEKRYVSKHKDLIKLKTDRHRYKQYGITSDEVKQMYEDQKGLCLICSRSIEKKFHIDHDHETKKVRGLLCSACNMALGLFKDNPITLDNAIKYLNK